MSNDSSYIYYKLFCVEFKNNICTKCQVKIFFEPTVHLNLKELVLKLLFFLNSI